MFRAPQRLWPGRPALPRRAGWTARPRPARAAAVLAAPARRSVQLDTPPDGGHRQRRAHSENNGPCGPAAGPRLLGLGASRPGGAGALFGGRSRRTVGARRQVAPRQRTPPEAGAPPGRPSAHRRDRSPAVSACTRAFRRTPASPSPLTSSRKRPSTTPRGSECSERPSVCGRAGRRSPQELAGRHGRGPPGPPRFPPAGVCNWTRACAIAQSPGRGSSPTTSTRREQRALRAHRRATPAWAGSVAARRSWCTFRWPIPAHCRWPSTGGSPTTGAARTGCASRASLGTST